MLEIIKNIETPEDVHLFRGQVIELAVQIETRIDQILLRSYCETDANKMKALHDDILCHTNWSRKVKALEYVLKRDSFSKLSKCIKSLYKIGEFGNRVAHWRWAVITTESLTFNRTDNNIKEIKKEDVESFYNNFETANLYLSKYFIEK